MFSERCPCHLCNKKALFLRVNVFNMRLVIENIIFSSSGGDENVFLYGHEVPSLPSALQSSAL